VEHSILMGKACVPLGATVQQALTAIDEGASSVALMVDEDGRLRGILTDGDMRRAILSGATLGTRVEEFANRNPMTVTPETSRAKVLDLMRGSRVTQIPVVNNAGVLVGLQTLTDIVGRPQLSNSALIMAGGKGTRLGALTKHTPKPLMTVADRTIIEWILLGLVESGINKVHVSVAFLAQQIMDHLGDGHRYGCEISYVMEDPDRPLNTAGAIGLLNRQTEITEPLIVTNADLMVRYAAADLLKFHTDNDAMLTIAARPYSHQVPFGVLNLDSDRSVQTIVEKPTIEYEISSGIYAVSPEAAAMVPYGEPCSMPELVDFCLQSSGKVAAWQIESDWIDVGTPGDLSKAKGL
jgi:dTDP-glucose pyrophosphorylase